MKELIGGISQNGCSLHEEDGELTIRGWFYPASAYDKISFYYNNCIIGEASIGIQRPDVFKKFADSEGLKSGFAFNGKLEGFDKKDDNILAVVYKNDTIVAHRISQISVVTYYDKLQDVLVKYGLSKNNSTNMFKEIQWIDTDGEADKYRLLDKNGQENTIEYLNYDIRYVYEKRKQYIISGKRWYEVCLTLEESGLKPIIDFVPVWYCYFIQCNLVRIDVIIQSMKEDITSYLSFLKKVKKLAGSYGNCQILKLCEVLASEKNFSEDFFVLKMPPLFNIKGCWIKNHRKIVSMLDLLIYQVVSVDNAFGPMLSLEYVISACKPSCKKVCIPNIYFTGYFPQFCNNKNKYVYGLGDKNLNRAWENGDNPQSIVDDILDEGYYTREFCLATVEQSLNELSKREEICEIKISDYIAENYKSKQLFFTMNHPTLALYYELITRILQYLGNNEIEFEGEILEQDGTETPIYPSVKKVLELEFEKSKYNFNAIIGEGPFSAREWMKFYIKKCFLKEK